MFRCSWRREHGYAADVFKEKFMQNHFGSVHHSEMAWRRGGAHGGVSMEEGDEQED